MGPAILVGISLVLSLRDARIPNPALVDAVPDTGMSGHRNAVFGFAALTSRLSCYTHLRTRQAMGAARLDGGKFGRGGCTRACLIGSRLNAVSMRFAQSSLRPKNMWQMLLQPKWPRDHV